MPRPWAGKWKGGRYYLDDRGRQVFFIERRGRTVRLQTHDEELAVGDLSRFLENPALFCRPAPEERGPDAPVKISKERLTLYMESIRHSVEDHRAARRSYLYAWADLGLDLRTIDKRGLRIALASFTGGHRGRTEALNAFARFLVKEGELSSWNPLASHKDSDPKKARAERTAYSIEELQKAFKRLTSERVRDVFHLRVATGMHQTEIDQITGVKVIAGPLPDKSAAIRKLDGKHEIAGVIQVTHKSRHRHRQPVDAASLAAALRLRESTVPSRITMYKQLKAIGIIPSNLRHTFVTLAAELGEIVSFTNAGVDRARIAQAVGHRAGSTMTADRYDKLQVPPMIRLPLGF